MDRLWRTLLGVDTSPVAPGADGGHLELTAWPTGAGTLGVLAAALVLLALVWWLYRREGRELSRGRRVLLSGLRLLTLLAVAAMLAEPVWVAAHRETVRSRLALVLDDSESMKFSDPYTDETRAAALAAALKIGSDGAKSPTVRLRETPRLDLVKSALRPQLEALERGREVHLYDLATASRQGGGAPSGSRKLDDVKANRGVSPLGDAIGGVLAAHRGQPVAGLVLATDGRSNAGEDPLRAAEAAARANIPIFAIAAGADEGPRNVRLAEVRGGPVVFVRDPTNLDVVVESRGLRDVEANVRLEQRVNEGPWEPVGTQKVALGDDGLLKRVTFRITPKVVGQYQFRASVDDAGPELTLEDNSATTEVKVVRQQIRLLMIAGGPSPEVQFLRNALMRDQHVEFAAWLQHADPGFRQPGDRPISRLPKDAEELRRYDALLLVDPDTRDLGDAWSTMITDFVGREAGGLIFVSGEQFSQQLFDGEAGGADKSGGSSWIKVLPVVRDPGLFRTEAEVRLSTQNTYALDLTPEGRGDPIFEFQSDPLRNRAVLASLPGMYWSFPVTRARPGATVLARHGDPRMQNQNGRHVLLASQLYGPGRTVFLGFDSTYRWRYLAEDYFDGFWARLVDRVGRNKALGGRLPFQVDLGKSVFRVGDTVTARIRYTEAAALAAGAELTAELEAAGQPPEPVRFEKSPDDPAVLTATFPAQQAGSYTLRVVPSTVGEAPGGVRGSTTTFRVEPPRREVDEPSLNRALLADLARATGGRVFELDDLDKLDEAIPTREVARTLETRDELWDAPMLAAVIMLALTTEWILRKRFRMV